MMFFCATTECDVGSQSCFFFLRKTLLAMKAFLYLYILDLCASLCMSMGECKYAVVPLHVHTLSLPPLLQYSCVLLVRDNRLRGNTADVAPHA